MYVKSLLAAAAALAFVGVVDAQTFRETATCKLTNTAVDRTLYEGPCSVKQSSGSGNITVFTIQMGAGEPFKFAGVRGQRTWMHGPEEVQFRDLPNGGIFRWSDFALVVAE